MPEIHRTPTVNVLKVYGNILYCFSSINSNDSIISELYLFNIQHLGSDVDDDKK